MTIQDILQQINHQRDALTGGALAPDAPADPAAPVVTGQAAQAGTHSLSDEDKLAKALKVLRQNGAGPGHGIAGLKKFGGTVLGYGEHQDADPGHTGKFAIVRRDGKLFHLFDDGTKLKIDQGAVARALGIRPKVAQLEAVPAATVAGMGNGTGGASAPAMPGLAALTGGAQAPADMAGPRGQDPLEALRRLLHQRA